MIQSKDNQSYHLRQRENLKLFKNETESVPGNIAHIEYHLLISCVKTFQLIGCGL